MLGKTILILLTALAPLQAGDLHEAARDCDVDRMRQLLSRQLSLDEKDEDGMTPLHIAIDARQVECAKLLLEAGADRAATDDRGRTAFRAVDQVADREARSAIRRYLIGNFGQTAFPSSGDPMGPAPWSLEYAVMRGQTGVTKMLLGMGADPNAVGTRGTTPLADGALKGRVDDVRALLEAGARVDAVSEAGAQPIHDAALGDSAEVIRELVNHGADVNARTRDGARTPLHFAAAMGKMKAVKALVALGADLNAQDSNGRTPLDAAERAGLTRIVALLKSASAKKASGAFTSGAATAPSRTPGPWRRAG